MDTDKFPLVVDLDDTLLRVDSFDEAMVWLFWHKPWRLCWLLIQKFWMKRAPFKWEFYQGVEMGELPFNQELVDWLREQKGQGRCLVLCSGTPQFYVEKIGRKLGELFDEFVGSSREVNRKGARKAAYLVGRFGERGFDYVGNSHADMKVWPHSRKAYNVNASGMFLKELKVVGLQVETICASLHKKR